jgi:hypothetical protein
MAIVLTARNSEVKINAETIEGLQSIEFGVTKNRKHIGAIGSDERISVYFGLKSVSGKLNVASANATLDKLLGSGESFSVSAVLKHGETTRSVSFDECFMEDKNFQLAAGGHGETVYGFTATRVREE